MDTDEPVAIGITRWPRNMEMTTMTKFLERSAVTLVVAIYGLALLPLLSPGLGIV